jgi:hypothetical protein
LQLAAKDLRADLADVLAAVGETGNVAQPASEDLRADRADVLAAVGATRDACSTQPRICALTEQTSSQRSA